MILPSITFLDLETTGATPLRDRITEIALVRFDNGIETARWQTLVNPEQPIPPFIVQLTGIENEMVANAPTFSQVADTLLAFLEGTVLSAHNVRFDHGFIKAEFKRIGITLRQKVLCTVKLSRLLYPQFKSHGLDAIMQRHNITTVARHRAMGDVESVLAFIEAANLELGAEALQNASKQLMFGPSLPPHLDAHLLEDMPDTPGVYLFYGDNQTDSATENNAGRLNIPLYIGKSINIRARVLSHFSSDHASTKEMRISQEIKHIEWIETAGELSALLLESRLVKERQPIHNRQLRNERQLCSWQLASDANTKPLLNLMREYTITPDNIGQLFGTFKTKRQALEVLRKIAERHQLCPQLLGLEAGKGACFSSQIKRCKGACCGREPIEMHYLRLQSALVAHKLKTWPYAGKIGIKEHSHFNDLTQVHVFEHWTYVGVANDDDALQDLLQANAMFKFDLDSYKLLLKAISDPKTQLIQFEPVNTIENVTCI